MNDLYITPAVLAKQCIDECIPHLDKKPEELRWYDPFKATGAYYYKFPSEKREWSEIHEKKDFFEFNDKIDIICSNPPVSILNEVLEHSVKLKPKIICYMIGVNNLTTKRIEDMEKKGYKIVHLTLLKVFKWFGMTYNVVWKKTRKKGLIKIDRQIYR